MTEEHRPLLASIPRILVYPIRGPGGICFLAGGAAMLTLAQSFITGLRRSAAPYLFLLSALLIASYLYRIVEETVTGGDRPPKLRPDDWEDAGLDLLHYLGGLLVAFLPVLILLVYAVSEQAGHLQRSRFQTVLGCCLALGTLYFPMALLLNGFSGRFATAFNFGVGLRGIRTLGMDYAVCCLFFLLAHGAWLYLEITLVSRTPLGLNADRMRAAAGTSLAGLYLSALQMRALGLAYRRHQTKLAWTLGEDA